MNYEKFSADNAALLLIDHQVGTMQLIKNIDRELAAKQSIALAKMAKILNMPVVLTSSQENNAQGRFFLKSPRSYQKRTRHGSSAPAWSTPGPIRTSTKRCSLPGASN